MRKKNTLRGFRRFSHVLFTSEVWSACDEAVSYNFWSLTFKFVVIAVPKKKSCSTEMGAQVLSF